MELELFGNVLFHYNFKCYHERSQAVFIAAIDTSEFNVAYYPLQSRKLYSRLIVNICFVNVTS